MEPAIPIELLQDPGYNSLTDRCKLLMIGLYREFYDCLTFTVDFEKPQTYGISERAGIERLMPVLVRSKLLNVVGRKDAPQPGPRIKVYAFRYSAIR